MYIDVLDKVKDYYLIYYNSELLKVKTIPEDISYSWSYNPLYFSFSKNIIFHKINNNGLNLYNTNKELKQLYEKVMKYINIHINLKTQLSNVFLSDIIPQHVFLPLLQLKEQTVKNYIKQKISSYDILLKIETVIKEIRFNRVNLDINHPQYDYLSQKKPYISYNSYKVKTGRMGMNSGYFPILTLDKKHRDIILPQYDYFLELDFNTAELRTALSLLRSDLPNIDIHQWHNQEKFNNNLTRQQIKSDFFSWFYSKHNKKDSFYEKLYNKEFLYERYYSENKVITPFGREINCDKEHFLNYLIQSTTSDMFFEQVYKVLNYIKSNKIKSKISFTLHDSLVLDIKNDEKQHFNNIKAIFKNTRFGDFLINESKGSNYGTMIQQ